MAQHRSGSVEPTPPIPAIAQPDPALKRLDRLVGTWELTGRTLGSKEDNISGRVTIEWMPGGYFLLQHGEMDILGTRFHSLEVLGYDPATDMFPSTVFSSMDGDPAQYYWDVQGNVVSHWTKGSKYTGTFSDDGRVLSGGWRPDEGVEQNSGNTYDAIMRRVK
jgi:uncharacterized protein DUF1579